MSVEEQQQRRRLPRAVYRASWAVLILGVVVTLTFVVAMAFSTTVHGTSMMPAVHDGDRLLVDVFSPHSVRRFDVVEVNLGSTVAVKRVIGMPGDTIEVRVESGRTTVLIRPAGSATTYRVVNDAWTNQQGSSVMSCCADDGTESPKGMPVAVPVGHYWVAGDNWGASLDSRVYGFVSQSDVRANLNLRLWPWERIGHVRHDQRLEPAS